MSKQPIKLKAELKVVSPVANTFVLQHLLRDDPDQRHAEDDHTGGGAEPAAAAERGGLEDHLELDVAHSTKRTTHQI